MNRPIYLDAHSTTPLDPRVVDAMLPWLTEKFGNASSSQHAYGWEAAEAVALARAQVAGLINAAPEEIVFTSGATESDNLALKGICRAHGTGARLVVSAIEHRAVLDTAAALEREGAAVVRVVPGPDGLHDPQRFAEAIAPGTTIVSLMHANNEIGTINDVAAVAALAHARGALLHTDAAQSAGRIPVDARALGADLMSLSAHKMHGPKGIGALWVRAGRPRIRLAPLIDGGGHEGGRRSGTLNVPAIAGFGAAAEIAAREMVDEGNRLTALRDRLRGILMERLPDIAENGAPGARLPHSLNVAFAGVSGTALVNAVPGVAFSTGSACSSASPEPSHVLLAIGDADRARCSVRFGLSRFTTAAEIDAAAEAIVAAVRELRAHSGLYGP